MPKWTPVFLPADVPAPKGPYSPAVRAGDFVYVSGQTPRDPVTGELGGDDVASQTRSTLKNLQRVLEQAGAGLEDVVSVTVYLERADDWDAMNAVYRSYDWGSVSPVRSTVAPAGGIPGNSLVEIDVIAYI